MEKRSIVLVTTAIILNHYVLLVIKTLICKLYQIIDQHYKFKFIMCDSEFRVFLYDFVGIKSLILS